MQGTNFAAHWMDVALDGALAYHGCHGFSTRLWVGQNDHTNNTPSYKMYTSIWLQVQHPSGKNEKSRIASVYHVV